jgi:hypothetical protein
LIYLPEQVLGMRDPLFPQKARGAMVVDGCPGEALHIEHWRKMSEQITRE